MKSTDTDARRFEFDSTASHPKHGIAMIYDLEGFSRFFNQPDVQDYVPKFLNLVSEALSIAIYGGKAYWLPAAENLESAHDRACARKIPGRRLRCIFGWNRIASR